MIKMFLVQLLNKFSLEFEVNIDLWNEVWYSWFYKKGLTIAKLYVGIVSK